MAKLTKQEMFDRAYRGLASQGWKRAFNTGGCRYATGDGRRCAWGWVDLDLGERDYGDVDRLHRHQIGLASSLDHDDVVFANQLQTAHDGSTDAGLQDSMHDLARRYHLTIPSLP